MRQNRWQLGFCPGPNCGSLQRSPDFLAGFEGRTLRPLLLRGEERTGEEGAK